MNKSNGKKKTIASSSSVLSGGNEFEGNKERVVGNTAFRGKFQIWLQDEYRHSNRAPSQHWWTGLEKEKSVLRAPDARDAKLVSAREDAGKKTLKDAANAFIATSAWQVEMMSQSSRS